MSSPGTTPAAVDAVTFYSTADGSSYDTTDPAEITRLRSSRKFSETKDIPVTIDQRYDPGAYDVPSVITYLSENPEQHDAVVAAERAGRNRKGITGDE